LFVVTVIVGCSQFILLSMSFIRSLIRFLFLFPLRSIRKSYAQTYICMQGTSSWRAMILIENFQEDLFQILISSDFIILSLLILLCIFFKFWCYTQHLCMVYDFVMFIGSYVDVITYLIILALMKEILFVGWYFVSF